MMIVRDEPKKSTIAVPRSRTHIMLKRMCSRLPCSQDAVSNVHHQPSPKTGNAPDMPKMISACELGEEKRHAAAAVNCRPLPDISKVSA